MSPRSRAASEQMKAASMSAILDAAGAVFAEQGFHAATTAAVAERAGVSKGLVFNYFKTKDDLLQALVEYRLAEQLAFWRGWERGGSPQAQLRQLLDRALDAVIAHPDAHRLYLSLFFQPGTAGAVQAAVDSMKPALVEYYALLQDIFASLGSTRPRVDAIAFQAALNGLAQTIVAQPALIRKPREFPLDELKARILSAFATAPPAPRHRRAARNTPR